MTSSLPRKLLPFLCLLLALLVSTVQGNELEQARAYMKSTSLVFSQVIEQVKPAVVFIEVVKTIKADGPSSHTPDDVFFDNRALDEFFNDKGERKADQPPPFKTEPTYAFGSGFIYNQAGYIITNSHVVKDAEAITVTLADKRNFQAEIIGLDPETDIGLLKIADARPLPSVPLGTSDQLKAGEWVLAIGSPHRFIQSVTAGIISATGRNAVGITDYENFIQTDAAINPGNSGGPLIDIDGKVIGINTAFLTQTGGYTGISFAIPVDMARTVAEQLVRDGKVTRSWLGVALIDAELSHLQKAGLPPTAEATVVVKIKDDSPAENAGLQKGDLITAIDTIRLSGAADLRNRIALTAPGSTVTLEIYRGDAKLQIEAMLASLQ